VVYNEIHNGENDSCREYNHEIIDLNSKGYYSLDERSLEITRTVPLIGAQMDISLMRGIPLFVGRPNCFAESHFGNSRENH